MMRRLFLQAVLVCAFTALAAIPASAGLTSDPLGATGSQPPVNAQGTAPAPVITTPAHIYPGNPEVAPAHSTGDGAINVFFGPYTEGDLHQGNTQAAPAHIYGEGGADSLHAAPVVAPVQIFPGAPEIGDINGDGYWDSDTDAYRDSDGDSYGFADDDSDGFGNLHIYGGSGADTLQGGPALAVAPPMAPGPQIVCLDGGCDDDQATDTDHKDWADKGVQP